MPSALRSSFFRFELRLFISGFLAAGSLASADVLPWPYSTDFEAEEGFTLGPLTSDPTWAFPDLVASITGDAFHGDQAFSFTGAGALTLRAPAGTTFGEPVIWVDFHSRPVFSPLTALPAPATLTDPAGAGFVKIDQQGELYAVDGDGSGGGAWTASGHRTALAGDHSADWLRISYRLDYIRKTWDLFVDGRLVLSDLGFLDASVTGFTGFSLRGVEVGATSLDHLYVGPENPVYADTSGDGLPDAWLSAHGLNPALAQRYADPDHDGLSHLLEFQLGLNPASADTDGDGVWDRREILFGADPTVTDPYVLGSVPFGENFEADAPGPFADGTRLWQFEGDSAVSAVIQRSAAPEGAQHLVLTGGPVRLERHFNDAGQNAVWLDFRLRAQPRLAAPAVNADVAAAFYFTDAGHLMALDGDVWRSLVQVSGFGSPVPAYQRLTLRLDYARQTWSLWHDGVFVAQDLGFANPVPNFSGFALGHHERLTHPAGLDGLVIGHSEPADFDTDLDGLTNEEEFAHGTDPHHSDTDGDGIWDGAEVAHGLDPLVPEALVARLALQPDGAMAWRTSFGAAEGYALGADLDQQLGWRSQSVTVDPAEDAALHAPDAATPASLEHLVASDGLKSLWLSFRARLEVGHLPVPASLSGPLGALFGYGAEGTLSTYDPALGRWRHHDVAAIAAEWNTYTLHLDYTARRWLLAVNGRLVARDLPFLDLGLTTLNRLRLLQEGSERAEPHQARLDDLTITNVEPAGLDFDGDDLLNSEELTLGTDPLKPDTDGDGMADGWEIAQGLDLLDPSGADLDLDGDSLTTLVEFQLGTDPHVSEDRVSGVLVAQLWRDFPGRELLDLTDSPRFPLQPTAHLRLDRLTLPFNHALDYGTRVRGYLLPPSDGDYVFWLAADYQASFWLSPTDSPFDRERVAWVDSATWAGDYNLLPTQRSAVISLKAGQAYYFEILQKGGQGYDQLNLAWRGSNGLRQIVTAKDVASFARRADDLDDDGLPDVWESAHGLSATQGHGLHGAYADFDDDGLSNLEEYQFGTDPTNPDTDGDGISDYEAVVLLGVDPTAGLFGGEPATVASLSGATGVAVSGDWETVDGGLEARVLRGSVGYAVSLSAPGIYRLDLVLRDAYEANPFRDFDVEVVVDGRSVGRLLVRASGTETGLGQLYLPWLDAGAHRIELIWHNGRPQSFLRVESLALVNPSTLDADGDGVADWMESRLDQSFQIDAETVQTAISPFTLEGSALFPDFLTATARYKQSGRAVERLFEAYGLSTSLHAPKGRRLARLLAEAGVDDVEDLDPATVELTVEPGLARHFFSHVPLDPEAPVRVRVEEGGGVRTVTKKLVWKPLNLLALEEGAELHLRDFDQLLVAAKKVAGSGGNGGPVTLTIVRPDESEELHTLKRPDVLELGFDLPGTYQFWVQPKNQPEHLALTVHVHRIELDPQPITMANALREWSPSALPEEVVVQADPTVLFDEKLPVQAPRRFTLSAPVAGGSLVARLGGEDGPVADALRLQPLVNYNAESDKWTIIQTFPDGTELWKATIDLGGGPLPPDLRIEMRVVVGGASFDDGSLVRVLTAADFDENGIYTYFMLLAPEAQGSVCHQRVFFDGAEPLGYQD